jgi:NAD(P)-dependent dehydrogenase (short-subunit alcohol dehydrogenase family)
VTAYLQELFGLTGRTALVTGGSSGIGLAIAEALGRAGARVILVARGRERLERAASQLSALGPETEIIVADLGKRPDVARVAERTEVDILVNAAGINPRPPMAGLTAGQWDELLAANLTAPFLLGQAIAPAMAARGRGRIINIASQQAFRAFGNSGGYGASKAGLVGLTRSQAEAWSRHGVTCNAIAPGMIRTPMTEAAFGNPELIARHLSRSMIGRNGVPADFAGCAVYLASDASAFVTGQTLFVDGGYSAT